MFTPEQLEILQRLESLERETEALKQRVSKAEADIQNGFSELAKEKAPEVEKASPKARWTPQMHAVAENSKNVKIRNHTSEHTSQKPKQ